eukprot:CAMPEP_0171633110 /NCGR_PEP_ID=MMETSP0990-20121206/24955_1 /TAXON_ID=483369 /ORGANISM="non described non described, Strain CCMP2098" /LENGTH=86 /DNA_ID=CAMNT_0012203659 /DNA_START=201 /DNA_END=461 /DNA_ORIENTATION=-
MDLLDGVVLASTQDEVLGNGEEGMEHGRAHGAKKLAVVNKECDAPESNRPGKQRRTAVNDPDCAFDHTYCTKDVYRVLYLWVRKGI